MDVMLADPACHRELPAIWADIWRRLLAGAHSSRISAHLLTVASAGEIAGIDQRTMVLRAASAEACTLRFHTDLRSPKVAGIMRDPWVAVHHYDPAAKIQLRMQGTAAIETDSAEADQAWAQATASSRRCYLAAPPSVPSKVPTSGLPAALEGRVPSLEETAAGRAQFAILRIMLEQIEWLHLAHDGHRRARFHISDGWHGIWLTP